MKNQWEVWTRGFSQQCCDQIVEKAMKYTPVDATIGFNDSNRSNKAYRSSVVRWLEVYGEDSNIAALIMQYVKNSNRSNFGFDISWMNEIQFTEYHGSSNGKYDWHHDVFWENPDPYDRKLSVVIQLSNPDEYKGGDFEFFNMPSPTDQQWKPRGSILIFPSFFPHRVTPVTQGVRKTLVTWVEGPKWR